MRDNHPAIIEPEIFDLVQKQFALRRSSGTVQGCTSIFSGRIICGDCGGIFGSKGWHSNDKYRRVIWQCNHKYADGCKCSTPHLDEKTIKALFLKAFNQLCSEKDAVIVAFDEIKDTLFDTSRLEAEQKELQNEMELVSRMSEEEIYTNAGVAQNQDEYEERRAELRVRYEKAMKRFTKLCDKIEAHKAKRSLTEHFLEKLKEQDGCVIEFSDDLWFSMIESVTVYAKDDIRFTFKNGTVIKVW